MSLFRSKKEHSLACSAPTVPEATMIKMLTGRSALRPASAMVLGIEVQKDPIGVRERVGIIPEQETPPSFLTATEYLHFVGAIRKIPDIRAGDMVV